MEIEAETVVPQYQTLCGNVFYLDNKSFSIACTLCEQHFLEPEDFFGHILSEHVDDEGNESSENEENQEEEEQVEEEQEMETVYLEEEYALEDTIYTDNDESAEYVDVVYDNNSLIEKETKPEDPDRYEQCIRNFHDLEPILGCLSKCHWIWGRSDKQKMRSSCLRFLRHKYFLANASSITAKDLEYKVKLLKSMQRYKGEIQFDEEYIEKLQFFNTKIHYDDYPEMLECPEENCEFLSESEEEICDHIFETHFVPDEKIYKCDFCDMKTKTYKTYLKHSKICAFNESENRKSDEQTEKPAKRKRKKKGKSTLKSPEHINMQCSTCGEQLGDDIEAFNQHMRQHNKIVKKSQLQTEPIIIETRKIIIQTPKSTKRSAPKPVAQEDLVCDTCGLTWHYSNVDIFNEHMRMHNKIQLFKCRICKKISGDQTCEECVVQDTFTEEIVVSIDDNK